MKRIAEKIYLRQVELQRSFVTQAPSDPLNRMSKNRTNMANARRICKRVQAEGNPMKKRLRQKNVGISSRFDRFTRRQRTRRTSQLMKKMYFHVRLFLSLLLLG